MSDHLDTLLPPFVRAARARAMNAANGVLPHVNAIRALTPAAHAAWDEVDDALRGMTDALRQWNDSVSSTLRLDGDGRDGHNGPGPCGG